MKTPPAHSLSIPVSKHRFWSLFLAAFLLVCGLPTFAADNPGDDAPPLPGSRPDASTDPSKKDGDPFYLHSGEFYFTNSFLQHASTLKLEFTPRYSTLSDFHGPLGYGWTYN